jgi:hypothetical protein
LIVLIANAHPKIALQTVLAQKDQLLEIGPGGAVRQTHHMREIERLTATNQSLQHTIGRKVETYRGSYSG